MLRPYRFPPLEVLLAQSRHAQAVHAAHLGEGAALPGGPELAQVFDDAVARGHTQGFEQGLHAGEQAGRAEGLRLGRLEAKAEQQRHAQSELQRLGAPLSALMTQLQALHADWQASLRKDMVDLVERVTRQVVRCELTLQPAQILALVEETLSGMPRRSGAVRVHLNPADLLRIQELDAGRIPDWQLTPDSALEAGECRLQVGEVEVDAGCRQRLSACMEQISEQLLPHDEHAAPAEQPVPEAPPALVAQTAAAESLEAAA